MRELEAKAGAVGALANDQTQTMTLWSGEFRQKTWI